MDKLNPKSDGIVTSFTLSAGTKFPLGSETVELAADAQVFIRKAMTRDAIVETIIGSGNAAANAANFDYTEGGMAVSYDGRGARSEAPIQAEEAPKPPPVLKPTRGRPKKGK